MTHDREKITEAANPAYRWLQSYNHSHGALILRDYIVQNLPGGGVACEHCLKEGLLRPLTDEECGAYYGTGWTSRWREAAGYQALVITIPQRSGIRIATPDDGPLPPNLFYWRGCPHRLSRQRTWQVLNAVWINSNDEFVKEASFRQLSQVVWARDDVDDGVIRGHLSKLSKWMMNEQLPLEVSGSRQTARVSIIDHQ